jgi:saccharopine dehydrogenase (NADP+, L-glutamate forming)
MRRLKTVSFSFSFERRLGLFSTEEVMAAPTPLDCLCAQLEKKLSFEKGDRDVVILHHIFEIKWRDGKKVLKKKQTT